MIEICGGATTGNCDTGSDGIASTPASEMNSATTHAKLGRSMKNLDMGPPLGFRLISTLAGRERDVGRPRFGLAHRHAG